MNALANRLSFRHAYLLAPSKESVYEEVYPHRARKAPVRPAEAVAALAPADVTVLYPTDLLRGARAEMPTYDRGDTHWNHFAGFQVANLLLRTTLPESGVQLAASGFAFHRGTAAAGDLQKEIPGWPKTERITASAAASAAELTFDSDLRNRGRTLVYCNPHAPLGSAILFGDSFGWSLELFLSAAFRRFVYVHSTSPDAALIEHERPELVVIEATERFAVEGPADIRKFSIGQVAATKLSRLPAEERAALRERYLNKCAARPAERFYAELFASACG